MTYCGCNQYLFRRRAWSKPRPKSACVHCVANDNPRDLTELEVGSQHNTTDYIPTGSFGVATVIENDITINFVDHVHCYNLCCSELSRDLSYFYKLFCHSSDTCLMKCVLRKSDNQTTPPNTASPLVEIASRDRRQNPRLPADSCHCTHCPGQRATLLGNITGQHCWRTRSVQLVDRNGEKSTL
jgi:hypothetical protein